MLRSPGRTRSIAYLFLKRVVGKKAAEQLLRYDAVRWLGYLHMLVIIPGKLREASNKQLNVNQFVSLMLRTKAIKTILKPKSPYLLSSTPFCDVSLVIWTTTKEKCAVYAVTSSSMRGKSRCREVGFQTKTKYQKLLRNRDVSNFRFSHHPDERGFASLAPIMLP